jgi:hypothetical protein
MTESVLGPSGSGSVVLNVGPGVGALVLHTPADLDGHEIEISPHGIGARPAHALTGAGTPCWRQRAVCGRLPGACRR